MLLDNKLILSYEYIDMSNKNDIPNVPAEQSFKLIAKRLKAIADPSRLAIMHMLCDGERNVTELVGMTGLTQANVSKHLRILREEGFVSYRRDHRRIFYDLSNELHKDICSLVCRSLEECANMNKEILESYWSTQGE
jgi:DNA-binding transcriptional ArsR family regulator